MAGGWLRATGPLHMAGRMRRVLALLTQIAEAGSAEEVWRLAAAGFAGRGFSRAVFGLARGPVLSCQPGRHDSLVLESLGPDLVHACLESGLFDRLPPWRWADPGTRAGPWSWPSDAEASARFSPDEMMAMRRMQELDISCGIVVDFPRFQARSRAVLALIADPGCDACDAKTRWTRDRDAILALAHVLHLSLWRQPSQPALSRLTRRQREALEWVADGKTTLDVALLMGVSPAMVEKHLRLARDLLDSDTTAQAVARAVAQNLLFPLREAEPPYTKEVGNP